MKKDLTIYPREVTSDMKAIKLSEVISVIDSFVIKNPFLFLTGGIVNRKKTKGDFDILYRAEYLPDRMLQKMKDKLLNGLSSELKARSHLMMDAYHGPFTSHIPLGKLQITKLGEKAEEKSYIPVGPSGMELGEEICLNDVLKGLSSVMFEEKFLWLVGELPAKGETEKYIDFVFRYPKLPPSISVALKFRIWRALPQEYWHRIRYRFDPNFQPSDTDICLGKLEFILNPEFRIVEMSLKNLTFKQRAASAEIKAQAKASAKEDKVKLFRFYLPLKPIRGYFPRERQTLDLFISIVAEESEGPWLSTKKYDGSNCLESNASIATEEGKKTIADLVRNKSNLKVLSYNEKEKRFEYRPIIGHFLDKKRDVWKVIRVKRLFGHGNVELRLTANHKVFTLNGLKKAKDLKINDKIITPIPKLNKTQEQVILGSLFGDGHLGSVNSGSLVYSEIHSIAQEEYLRWKSEILGLCVSSLKRKKRKKTWKGSYEGSKDIISMRLKSLPSLREFEDFYDKDKKKRVLLKYLEQLEDLGLACWIMDDGSLAWNVRPRLHLYTNQFSKEDVEIASKYFERKGFKNSIYYARGYYLGFSANATEKILQNPYLRLNGKRKDFNRITKNESQGYETAKVLSNQPYDSKKKPYRYNLEVAKNHNFVANGLLVKNCEIHYDKGKVKIISEDGEDNTDRFPKLIEELKKLGADNFSVVAEVELWKKVDGELKHQPREAVIGRIHRKGDPDETGLVANVYDITYLNGKDIHNEPFEKRLQALKSLKFPQATWKKPNLKYKLNRAPAILSKTADDIRKHTQFLRRLDGSEGNVIKLSTAKYRLDGKRSNQWKFHNSGTANVIVIEAIETKVPKIWNYSFGLDPQDKKVPEKLLVEIGGKKYLKVGKTFSSARPMKKGDVFILEYETLNLERDEKTDEIKVTAWSPRELGKTDKKVDTIDSAIRKAKVGLVFQEKVIPVEGEIIYKVGLTSGLIKIFLQKIVDIKDYDATKLRTRVLRDDWRIATAWATWKMKHGQWKD